MTALNALFSAAFTYAKDTYKDRKDVPPTFLFLAPDQDLSFILYEESTSENLESFLLRSTIDFAKNETSDFVFVVPTHWDEVPFTSGDSIAFIGVSSEERQILVCDIRNGKLGKPYSLDESDMDDFDDFVEVHPTFLLRQRLALAREKFGEAHSLLRARTKISSARILRSTLADVPKAVIIDEDEIRFRTSVLGELVAKHSASSKDNHVDQETAVKVAVCVVSALIPLIEHNIGLWEEINRKPALELALKLAKPLVGE